MQVFYGLATSTEVAYYTYIYAKVSKQHYQKVTSFTRCSLLLGRFLAGVVAQVLVSFNATDYRGLNVVSLASVSAATVVGALLPTVNRTLYFHRENEGAAARVKHDFLSAFRSFYVTKWSLWWALGMCGNFQVGNYIQLLWEEVDPAAEEVYNGGVEATTTFAGAALAFLFGFLRFNWKLIGEPVLFVVAFLNGVTLVVMARTDSLWTAYAGYLVYRALYQFLITVASYEIARHINDESYGLVFGINTFLALAFQTVLTLVVVDDVGLALNIRDQFRVYGGFWIVIGVLFVSLFVVSLARDRRGYIKLYQEDGVWVRGPGHVKEDEQVRLRRAHAENGSGLFSTPQ